MYAEAEADATVPLGIRAHSIVEGKVLIIAMNLSAPSNDVRRVKEINTLVTGGYAQAVANHDRDYIGGKIPSRLRIAEVNNTGAPPKTLYMNTSLAREYYTGQIDAIEFSGQYLETKRNMTEAEIRATQEMDRGANNVTLYNDSAG